MEENIPKEIKLFIESARFISFILFHILIFSMDQNKNLYSIMTREIIAEIGRVFINFFFFFI